MSPELFWEQRQKDHQLKAILGSLDPVSKGGCGKVVESVILASERQRQEDLKF